MIRAACQHHDSLQVLSRRTYGVRGTINTPAQPASDSTAYRSAHSLLGFPITRRHCVFVFASHYSSKLSRSRTSGACRACLAPVCCRSVSHACLRDMCIDLLFTDRAETDRREKSQRDKEANKMLTITNLCERLSRRNTVTEYEKDFVKLTTFIKTCMLQTYMISSRIVRNERGHAK